ncbi:NADP:D-xylose dehydrogenase [Dactylonectria estremocensis]|uniref:D-xylose 1-dehydrogenase (NADP(+), D-xylono-1,5-lactone-forming) n=1 Tax=Dactylonectria estremocensis TaxID=1079267 RepID=A0A9P9E5D0_9HYPO|nr:NADP:D-xylose dehydrogenase [Dactylonectria estremocensis]
MTLPFSLRWGIMATGSVAEAFSRDLLTNPGSRSVSDVQHRIVAVASRRIENAQAFATQINAGYEVATYGSYSELVSNPDVDIVYVATPHSHHFQNVMLALSAGKHVLCEKAFTVTTEQARRLVDLARSKNLFLMEAVWTRFMPISQKIRDIVTRGEIGVVTRVTADLSFNKFSNESGQLVVPDSHRMVNLDLAGGTLLNYGLYSLTWVFQILFHLQPESEKEKPTVLSAMNKYHTGVDESIAIICHFPHHGTLGIATSSLRVATHVEAAGSAYGILIQGSKGEISVAHPAYQPTNFRIVKTGAAQHVEIVECPVPKDSSRDGWGHGFFWEADEVARCIRDGKTESGIMPLNESLAVMETMEQVLKQGDLAYPEHITNHKFDANDGMNTGK